MHRVLNVPWWNSRRVQPPSLSSFKGVSSLQSIPELLKVVSMLPKPSVKSLKLTINYLVLWLVVLPIASTGWPILPLNAENINYKIVNWFPLLLPPECWSISFIITEITVSPWVACSLVGIMKVLNSTTSTTMVQESKVTSSLVVLVLLMLMVS